MYECVVANLYECGARQRKVHHYRPVYYVVALKTHVSPHSVFACGHGGASLQACAKARDYLLQKIGELRRPKTNVQIIQKNSLLK